MSQAPVACGKLADNEDILRAIADLKQHFDRKFSMLSTDVRLLRDYVRLLGGRTQALEDEKLAGLTPLPEDVAP